ncbi:hypothetical protein DPMN_089107 [Dreissena polymorpha]|uniref:Uncharacterized protein n=1 Tax=Dreissena polymorpha TaxID=45954 RepID=A0A9D4KVB8_DREPO|nr:hypothetical protein DPMN_089107 [Dreissena polymorpha]
MSEEDLKALDRDKDSKNTKRVVKHGMNLYNAFLRSKYMDLGDLVENPTYQPAIELRFLFFYGYASVRKKNGDGLKKVFGQSEVWNFQSSLKHV